MCRVLERFAPLQQSIETLDILFRTRNRIEPCTQYLTGPSPTGTSPGPRYPRPGRRPTQTIYPMRRSDGIFLTHYYSAGGTMKEKFIDLCWLVVGIASFAWIGVLLAWRG